jgi:hypothetical protein
MAKAYVVVTAVGRDLDVDIDVKVPLDWNSF